MQFGLPNFLICHWKFEVISWAPKPEESNTTWRDQKTEELMIYKEVAIYNVNY